MKKENVCFDLTPDLRSIVLRHCQVGTVVTTKSGYSFELIARVGKKETWKDLFSGLIWYDKEDEHYTYNEAIKKFGNKLPTTEEFEMAEKNGFREILPNMNAWFWSSSLYPGYSDGAQYFYGYYGYVVSGSRDEQLSVRCVGR